MRKYILSAVITALFLVGITQVSWLIYHKPEYKGKVIDSETRQPIEGAVVAVYYMKENLGGVDYVIHTKEALTDSNGEFVIPSYTTLIAPYSFKSYARFIVYKPGYGSHPGMTSNSYDPEIFFSKKKAGEKANEFTYGILELPPLKTARGRIVAIPPRPAGCRSEEFPLLYKLINEERRRYGMGEIK